jgi:hypothetical protein
MRNGLGQTGMILDLLEDGIGLTGMEALTLAGSFRLPARVDNLRDEGHTICSVWEESRNAFGESKRYKRYFLVA